jgi:hypothetical protein
MGGGQNIRARFQSLFDCVFEWLGLERRTEGQTQARNGERSENLAVFHQVLLLFDY